MGLTLSADRKYIEGGLALPLDQNAFFDTLYHESFAQLNLFAKRQLLDSHAAEELVQDTFFTAWTKKETLIRHEKPRGFLMEILKLKIQAYRRERKKWARFLVSLDSDVFREPAAPPSSPPAIVSDMLDAIQEVLNEGEWMVFQRFKLLGLTHMQIAEELDISVWASQKRLERAQQKLQKTFGDEWI